MYQAIATVEQEADFIEKFYEFLKEQGRSCRIEACAERLSFILSKKDDVDFIAQLNARELKAFSDGQNSLTYFLLDTLRPAHRIYGEKNKKEDFEKYIALVSSFLPILTKEVLDHEFEWNLLRGFINNKHTALSLALSCLHDLREEDLRTQLEKHDEYEAMIKLLIENVIHYLLNLEVDVDKGFVHCISVLTICLTVSVPVEDDLVYQLAHQLLTRVKNLDRRQRTLDTAFTFANRKHFPEDFQRILILKGADVNVLFRQALLFTYVEEPLLNDAIRKKDYNRMRFLLDNGADPNCMPKLEDEYVPDTEKSKVCVLTPYQLACSIDDQEAIEIIRSHCQKYGIPLNLQLDPFEEKRNRFFSLQGHKYQGPALFIQLSNHQFGSASRFVSALKEKFGLQCFVEKNSDVPNVTIAINWLFEQASNSCAARFWLPVLEKLRQEIAQVSNFAIYVGDTADKSYKQQNKSALGVCLGLYHGNISVQTDLTMPKYIEVIVHEMGHLYDDKTVKFKSIYSVLDKKAVAFKNAMNNDIAHFKTLKIPMEDLDILELIYTIEVYPENKRAEEYFTRVLFEIPVTYAYVHPNASENDLMQKMKSYFPQTMVWFEENFPAIENKQSKGLTCQ